MEERSYPKKRSDVTITFTDGEVKTYQISAGASIAGHLIRESQITGTLILRDDDVGTATCIPVNRIREVSFAPSTEAPTEIGEKPN